MLLQFGFGTESTRKWVARQAQQPFSWLWLVQVVPPTWILSGVEAPSMWPAC